MDIAPWLVNQDWCPHSVHQYGVSTILSDDPVAVAVSRPRFEGGPINMSFFNIVQPSSELPQPTFFLALTLSVTVVRYRNMEPSSWVMVSSNIRFSYCFLQVPCGKSGVDPQKNLHGRQRRKRGKNPCSRRSPTQGTQLCKVPWRWWHNGLKLHMAAPKLMLNHPIDILTSS